MQTHSLTEHKHLAFYGFACGSVCRWPTKVTATDTCGAAKLKCCMAFCSEGAGDPWSTPALCRLQGRGAAGGRLKPQKWAAPMCMASARGLAKWQAACEMARGREGQQWEVWLEKEARKAQR